MRPRLRVLGPGGIELLKIEAERAGEGAGIPNVGLPDQVEVWLEVGAMDGATSEFPYTVSIHRPERPYEGALEREPNDALELAQALVPGEVIAGFLHRAEDVDHFRLALSVPASVSIQLTPDAATDAVLDWLPMGAGGLDLGGEGEPESICAWGVGAGEHAVGVTRSHAGPSLPRYVLRARVEAEPVEREPNDLADGAALQELVDGMRGYIGTGGDVDAYRLRLFGAIDGQTSQLIRVEPGSGVDVAVEVTDADGASVTPRADAGGPGAREEVTVPLATGLRVVISEGQRGGHGCETAYVVRLPR